MAVVWMGETGPFIYDGPDPDLVYVGWTGEVGQAIQDGPDPDLAIQRMDGRDWSVNL
jgi:hypothetical protein